MDIESPEVLAYLNQLNTMANGDPDTRVSMHEVGEVLGLDKDASGQMAETLFIGGHAELKTLSGGIGITSMGLEALGIHAPVSGEDTPVLSHEVVMTGADTRHLDVIVADIKSAMSKAEMAYEDMEALVVDLKTIEVHMLSPKPKTAVVREVLKSVHQNLENLEHDAFPQLSARIAAMVS